MNKYADLGDNTDSSTHCQVAKEGYLCRMGYCKCPLKDKKSEGEVPCKKTQ